MKERRKFNLKKFVILIIFITSLIGLIYSTYQIIMWSIDSNKTNEQITQIQKDTTIKLISDDNAIVVDPEYNQYWDFIHMNMIDVDFDKLKQQNSDTVGWIQLPGTNINYPFVQTNNNEYYLNKSFNKKRNDAGWVFLDYRNNIQDLNKNTIIYAHGRLEKTMFGSLKDTMKNSWLQDPNNYLLKLSTENMNSIWQVFSIYHIPTTSDYLYINFYSDDNFLDFANMLTSRSIYDFKTTINKDDKLITLSTCYNNDERMVLHAKLIKYELK